MNINTQTHKKKLCTKKKVNKYYFNHDCFGTSVPFGSSVSLSNSKSSLT